MQLEYHARPHWPPLAWDATCRSGSPNIVVRHGPGVETHPEWFGEAVWDGEFGLGNFDQTDLVFGSGARLRDGRLLFVSAGSTVDRLQSVVTDDGVRVSNSLVCLIEGSEVALDPSYEGYNEDFRSIVKGLATLEAQVHTLTGSLSLCYFDNLSWDGQTLGQVAKPANPRDFGSFEGYETFLISTLRSMRQNAEDPARTTPFRGLGTISTGYDSPTIAAIGKRVGAFEEVITFTSGRSGPDDGTPIAQQLGLTCTAIERDAYRRFDCPEVPFLASNANGEESHYRGAEHLLCGRILYTGYHGDKVWAKQTKDSSPNLVRGDPSGLALTEYRIRAGFIHCPVPFMGVRQIADLQKISNSQEMKRWDVSGDYSRPICRRIVETAGVDGQLFGRHKNAASVTMYNADEALTPSSTRDFHKWLEDNTAMSPSRRARAERFFRLAHLLLSRLPRRVPEFVRDSARRRAGGLFRYAFPWAVERAGAAYRD